MARRPSWSAQFEGVGTWLQMRGLKESQEGNLKDEKSLDWLALEVLYLHHFLKGKTCDMYYVQIIIIMKLTDDTFFEVD
jgi:hypothetical protein